MIDDVLLETIEKMDKAVAHTQAEFATVRTGRATPALLEKLKVDYYGTEVPLKQLAGFNLPVEVPDLEATRQAIEVPELPCRSPAAAVLLGELAGQPLDPWEFRL